MKFVSKWSEDLTIGDEFKIGNLLVKVSGVTSRKELGQMIFNLTISGPNTSKQNTATLILPKKLPIEVLQ